MSQRAPTKPGRQWQWPSSRHCPDCAPSGSQSQARRGQVKVRVQVGAAQDGRRAFVRLHPDELKPKKLTSHCSHRGPVTPGWHSHCPLTMSHWPLAEPMASQLHLWTRRCEEGPTTREPSRFDNTDARNSDYGCVQMSLSMAPSYVASEDRINRGPSGQAPNKCPSMRGRLRLVL